MTSAQMIAMAASKKEAAEKVAAEAEDPRQRTRGLPWEPRDSWSVTSCSLRHCNLKSISLDHEFINATIASSDQVSSRHSQLQIPFYGRHFDQSHSNSLQAI